MVIPGHNLGNSQVSVNRTIGPTLVYFKSFELMSLGIDIYTHLYSRLLWQRGRVSDCHPGDQRSPTLGTKRDR